MVKPILSLLQMPVEHFFSNPKTVPLTHKMAEVFLI
jgi:hypothetical protein